MTRRLLTTTIFATLIANAAQVYADPGKPNFMPALWGDGELWGTKGTTVLPMPNDHNLQSFDKLFIFVGDNVATGQLPVSEAAPGNPDYSGGRWYTQTAQWNMMDPPLVTSYSEIDYHVGAGNLTVMPGSPGGPPMFFQCPLLPVNGY